MSEFVVGFLIGALATAFVTAPWWRGGCPYDALAAWRRKAPAPAGATVVGVVLPAPGSQSQPGELQAAVRALTGPAEDVSDPRELPAMPEFQAVVAAMRRPEMTLEALGQYAFGANWPAACAAFVVLAERPDRQTLCEETMRQLGASRPYVLVYLFRYLLALEQRPPVGAAVLPAPGWWEANPVVPGFYREYFAGAAALGDEATFGDALTERTNLEWEPIRQLLDKINHPFATELSARLRAWLDTRVDREALGAIGSILSADDRDPHLVEPPAWRSPLDNAEAAILQERPRSVLVTGAPGTGKTAFVELLAGRLQERGYTIFAATGVELMAGQIYIGQLEGRVRQLLDALNARRKIAWCVPDFIHLADSGSHKGQSASLLEQILPAIASGDLIVIGEATQKAATRLFQLRPSLRALLEIAPLEPMAVDDATGLAFKVCERIRAQGGLEVPAQTVQAASDLSQHYLGANQSPGALVGLLRRSVARARAEGCKTVAPDRVVATLSQMSGLPETILDNSQRIDLGEIRGFFGRRVIGQDEAIRVLVDRIAMLKAGLTDPGKPIGVFLFAGPTGTGKTELAKALAEFLFGSPERLVRLDMSEFQSVESTSKILGERGASEGDALIDRIRKQPFSIVLLDEFEKAHPNCWDLFLQIFDDGRLTDANGREADFRHTIIILTSNLGATAHQGAGIGFGQRAQAFSDDQVMRTIGQTFRPEFINRLDKVVVFQPLSRELMRGILNKELALVLGRRGLRDRDWAVEWEPSAIEFLLDRGFTTALGARPLKRAIDQHLLASLAATLVEHRAPDGDQFLFIRSDGERIEVEFVDPDSTGEPANASAAVQPAGSLRLEDIVLRPQGRADELQALSGAWREIASRLSSEAWRKPLNDLQLRLSDPTIWSSDERHKLFSVVELADRIDEAAEAAERLLNRCLQARSGAPSRDIVGRLALQLYNLQEGIEDLQSEAPIDAIVRIDCALDTGDQGDGARIWRSRLYEMYRGWSLRRRMQLREVVNGTEADGPILVVAGFGSYRTLSREAGLHVLEAEVEGEVRRVAARVIVSPGLDVEVNRGSEAAALARRLAAAPALSRIKRRYREAPAPLVRDVQDGWRSGKLEEVLAGGFDLIGAAKRKTPIAAE